MEVITRNHSLDALRGLAILLMVLSSSISFGVLPSWMYHAQVPPPYHIFKPELPGITWVDLVFPFFLFTMGAAIPLALHKKLAVQPVIKTAAQIIQRYLLLVVFALFTFYARAWVMTANAGWQQYLLSIGCFLLLFPMYARLPELTGKVSYVIIKVLSFSLAAAFLLYYPFKNGFNLDNSDVIIIVLANMAFFGTSIWWFTRNRPLLRIGILPLIMAVLLTANELNSWNSVLFNWSPLAWMYKFYYLKYLFIVLPGTFAGEWLLQRARQAEKSKILTGKMALLCIASAGLVLLMVNVVCLYTRLLVPNMAITLLLSAFILITFKKMGENADQTLFKKLAAAGIYLLILGLFFEAFEGGIKKDISTFSYYFVCAGLAFLLLMALTIFEKLGCFLPVIRYLGDTGKNPMVAYTAGNLLLIPLLKITGAGLWLDAVAGWPAGGFLRGLIFTGIVSLITVYCTKKNLFWRT